MRAIRGGGCALRDRPAHKYLCEYLRRAEATFPSEKKKIEVVSKVFLYGFPLLRNKKATTPTMISTTTMPATHQSVLSVPLPESPG